MTQRPHQASLASITCRIDVSPAPSDLTNFPYTVPDGSFLITWGLNNKIKIPYSESFDASVQRLLPGGFTLDVSYVGRLGCRLLQQVDFAAPTDFVGSTRGGDWYNAITKLSKISDQHQGGYATVAPIPYFAHVFPRMAFDGKSATQNIYSLEVAKHTKHTKPEKTKPGRSTKTEKQIFNWLLIPLRILARSVTELYSTKVAVQIT